jgi:hypothetical protein
LDSAEEQWGGKGSQTPATLESHGEVHLISGPWTFLVFEQVLKKTNNFEASAVPMTQLPW